MNDSTIHTENEVETQNRDFGNRQLGSWNIVKVTFTSIK